MCTHTHTSTCAHTHTPHTCTHTHTHTHTHTVLTDIEFVKTFLYTYQSFATPDKLLRKLIERYNVVRPEGMSAQGFAVMKQTIQARVVNAMKLWVELLSVDFKGEHSTSYHCALISMRCEVFEVNTLPTVNH